VNKDGVYQCKKHASAGELFRPFRSTRFRSSWGWRPCSVGSWRCPTTCTRIASPPSLPRFSSAPTSALQRLRSLVHLPFHLAFSRFRFPILVPSSVRPRLGLAGPLPSPLPSRPPILLLPFPLSLHPRFPLSRIPRSPPRLPPSRSLYLFPIIIPSPRRPIRRSPCLFPLTIA
jgi:hypothetical protein